MVNKIIKIEKVETNNENNITNVIMELDHGVEQNISAIIEFRGDANKTSLEKFREEKLEKGGHLVKYNPDFFVDRKKFKDEKELGWKYFPLEPILDQEKISSEEIIYISALDYRVGMLCIPAKERLGCDINLIEVLGNDKNKLAEFHGNYPIFIDSSKEFRLFSDNKQNQKRIMRYACKCGMKFVVANCGNNAATSICPNCKSTISNPGPTSCSLTWTELAYIEVAYRSLQREKEILKDELGHKAKHAETMDNRYLSLLEQEKEAKKFTNPPFFYKSIC